MLPCQLMALLARRTLACQPVGSILCHSRSLVCLMYNLHKSSPCKLSKALSKMISDCIRWHTGPRASCEAPWCAMGSRSHAVGLSCCLANPASLYFAEVSPTVWTLDQIYPLSPYFFHPFEKYARLVEFLGSGSKTRNIRFTVNLAS